MVDVFNFNYFQIPQTGLDDSAAGYVGERQFGVKMSNFGDLNFRGSAGELVKSDDYTKTTLGFSGKQDWSDTVPDDLETESDENPYVAGSGLKKVRDDQFVRMTMAMGGYQASALVNIETSEINPPDADVMDTKVAAAEGMEAPRSYPTEGWKSFGGKYDKSQPYQG
jgi:hypothetical protein